MGLLSNLLLNTLSGRAAGNMNNMGNMGGMGGLGNLLQGNMANLMGGQGNLLQKFQMLNQNGMNNNDIQVDLDSLEQNPESNTLDIREIKNMVGGNRISLGKLKDIAMSSDTLAGNSLRDIFKKLGM